MKPLLKQKIDAIFKGIDLEELKQDDYMYEFFMEELISKVDNHATMFKDDKFAMYSYIGNILYK